MPKVVAALSGGVDSSVAAALLVKQGYDVHGVTLRLWSEPGCEQENRCCTPESRRISYELCQQLEIPFEILDAVETFRQQVVGSFLDGYLLGDTPNPCVFCNRHIKWGFLLDYANAIGADYVATGHYARIKQDSAGLYELWQGLDPAKDQTYMLSMLDQHQLSKTLFPLGEYRKEDVRQLAHQLSLPSADLPESQDLCFLGQSDYRDFLRKYTPQAVNPGQILTRNGETLGEHQGLPFYTIGQRKGLPASSQALYVLEKRVADNTLIVGFEDSLGRQVFSVGDINWISGKPPAMPLAADVKIRFKAPPAEAHLSALEDGKVQVHLTQPLRDVTPGQRAVFYQDAKVMGGGRIDSFE